uniref:dual-specificity kinase n=1 Tax=Steinernema glaseri TaxID=37863 RepID=A0A1I7YQK0_9BILA
MMVHPSISDSVDMDGGIACRFRQFPALVKQASFTRRWPIQPEQSRVARPSSPEELGNDRNPKPTTSSGLCDCCALRDSRLTDHYVNGNYLSYLPKLDQCAPRCCGHQSPKFRQNGNEKSSSPDESPEPQSRPRLHTSSSFEVLRNDIGPLHSIDDFIVESHLGGGFFGDVCKIRRLDDPTCTPLVMKVAKIDESRYGVNSRLRAKRNVLHEARILQILKHPNILKSRGGCVELKGDRWDIHLLVDYCDMGSLHCMILNKHIDMPWLLRFGIVLDIANAMQFVHDSGYMHRDLTSMNILLQSCRSPHEIKAVVADFGLSCERPIYPHRLQQVGTLNWMAPETLKEEYYDEKADVFAFGVILCQIIARIDADHDAVGLLVLLDEPVVTSIVLEDIRTTERDDSHQTERGRREIYEQLSAMIATKRNEDEGRLESRAVNSPYRANSCYGTDSRLERSHSDAAIRPTELYAQSTGKPARGAGTSRSSTTSVLPEGVAVDDDMFESSPSVCSPEDTEARMKQLALSVASEDPDYAESESNPFRTSDRPRCVRKFTPKWTVDDSEQQTSCIESQPDANIVLDPRCPMSVKHTRKESQPLRRTVSMPSFTSETVKMAASLDDDIALSLPSKRINNAGIGAQRDLQGKMMLTFRDYDQKFTSLRYPARRRATIEKEQPETFDLASHNLVSVRENSLVDNTPSPSPSALPTLVIAREFRGTENLTAYNDRGCMRRTSKLSGCTIM